MAGGLRKTGGKCGSGTWYTASGTLVGITGPGRRTVEVLGLRRLGPGEDLSAVARFPDLKRIEFDHVEGIDLAPLADSVCRELIFKDTSSLDLAPLAAMPHLELLLLANFESVRIPSTFGPALSHLAFFNDDPDLTGEPVRHAIEAIDWARMDALHGLHLGVGGLYEMRPIEVDLGFLRSLPLGPVPRRSPRDHGRVSRGSRARSRSCG